VALKWRSKYVILKVVTDRYQEELGEWPGIKKEPVAGKRFQRFPTPGSFALVGCVKRTNKNRRVTFGALHAPYK